MHIGVVLPQLDAEWPETLAFARFAEELGVDSIWVVDHVLGRTADQPIMEAWTVMSALASSTKEVEVGAQVLCQSFRNPALLAKMAATLDHLSGGRLRLMIGAGWYQMEYESYGWEFPSPGVRFEQLRDTVRILKGLLSSSEPFSYNGKQYRVENVINQPPPVRSPLPVEVGGVGDRMLSMIAAEADGWNCPGAFLSMVDDRLEYLTKQCENAGRNIDELRLTVQIACAVGDDEAAQQGMIRVFGGEHALVGSVDKVAGRVEELQGKGIEGFHVILPRGDAGKACLERLVNEVKPRVS